MATNIWTGAVNNDWTDPGNWSLGHVPTGTDDIQIGDINTHPTVNVPSGMVTLQNTVSNFGTITVASGAVLSVVGATVLNGAGTVSMASGSAIQNAGGSASLENVDNTIAGTGTIGTAASGSFTVTNDES